MNPLKPGAHAVELGGLTQRYHVRGRGPHVLVAMPGGPGVGWEYLRMPAVEQRMTVVYVEPLGTGQSGRMPGHPHGYTRDVYAEALDRLLDHLGRERVFLLGHGYGGNVAQLYAARRPERLTGLVLYASTPVNGAEHIAETSRQLSQFVRRNQWNPELPAVLEAIRSLDGLTDDDQLGAAVRGLFPACVAHYWARKRELTPLRSRIRMTHVSGLDAVGLPEVIDDRAMLPAISVPVLVVTGCYDIYGGLRWGRELHALIPGARLLVLAYSGHIGHVEEPERFAEGLASFVRGSETVVATVTGPGGPAGEVRPVATHLRLKAAAPL
jgi:proline iminopeptidase